MKIYSEDGTKVELIIRNYKGPFMNDIKVLIIEDEPLIAEDIAACLRRCDYRVTGIVYSAEDALPELARNPPDIAMIDINLNGGQEGISIANAINERFLYSVCISHFL